MKNWKRISVIIGLFALMVTFAAGCRSKSETTGQQQSEQGAAKLSGTIRIDGSSTVFSISEAVGEEFQKLYPEVRVTVGVSGTGGGFKKFTAGETDISDASRPVNFPV